MIVWGEQDHVISNLPSCSQQFFPRRDGPCSSLFRIFRSSSMWTFSSCVSGKMEQLVSRERRGWYVEKMMKQRRPIVVGFVSFNLCFYRKNIFRPVISDSFEIQPWQFSHFSFLDHDLNKSNLLPEELEWNLFVVPLAMVNTWKPWDRRFSQLPLRLNITSKGPTATLILFLSMVDL